MEILRFQTIFKQALWGGTRLESRLNKRIGSLTSVAESWEIADLSRDQSVVESGSFEGMTIQKLLESKRMEVLGKHADRERFPLLVKFLDAERDLSVQVHPGLEMARRFPDVSTGKAEFWIVLEALPGSTISAGLKEGVNREQMVAAIEQGTVPELLNTYEVAAGDCIFLEPGTVHSLGAGILVAEIQEPNNTTYRLDDWGRLGPDGKPRELHTELALEAINFELGPIRPEERAASIRNQSTQLLQGKFFNIDLHAGEIENEIPGDDRSHVLTVIEGSANINCDGSQVPLALGETVVLPAERANSHLSVHHQSRVLDSYLE